MVISTDETISVPTALDTGANLGIGTPDPEIDNMNTAPATTTTNTATETVVEADSTDIFNNLSMDISTGGANLSQGQRQLVCLARALLARPKIVIMDEATSAVDRATDTAIQSSLRDEFAAAGCTVLVIAHRLSTVADFDRILVLEAGSLAEIGTPKELLEAGMRKDAAAADAKKAEDGTGAFWELVQKSSEKDKLIGMVLGNYEA